jgi:hypothetical protein
MSLQQSQPSPAFILSQQAIFFSAADAGAAIV